MALKKFERRRVPLNGEAVCVLANLQRVLCEISRADHTEGDVRITQKVNTTWVPVYVRMEPHYYDGTYSHHSTSSYPKGVVFRPVCRIGSMESEETDRITAYTLFSKNSVMDGYFGAGNDWHYDPCGYESPGVAPGEDTSFYECSQCQQEVFLDLDSSRSHNSATLVNGQLACRDCDARGLITYKESYEQLERCRRLAAYLSPEHVRKFDSKVSFLANSGGDNNNRQCKLFPEDQFSFAWTDRYRKEDGTWGKGLHGGLIQHGPHVEEIDLGTKYRFRTWDYTIQAERDSTPEEIQNIEWSIHT